MAAYDNPVLVLSESAGIDLSTHQFKAVKYDGSGNLILCTAGALAAGVLQNDPTSGQAGDVMVLGVSRAIAGGSFAKGVALASNAAGLLVAAAGGDHVVGVSRGAAGASGDIVPVLVTLGGKH